MIKKERGGDRKRVKKKRKSQRERKEIEKESKQASLCGKAEEEK